MSGVVESVGPSVQQQVVEYVVKIASRCNLSCDHCYVYRDPDRGWLAKPLFIEPSTARAAAGRIAATGVRVLTDTFTARQARGEGRFRPDKLPYLASRP